MNKPLTSHQMSAEYRARRNAKADSDSSYLAGGVLPAASGSVVPARPTSPGESLHTPGPWVYGYGEGVTGPTAAPLVYWDRTDVKSQIVSSGKEVVAAVARAGGLTDTQHANLRLIAAAPDLLAAVRTLLDAMDMQEKREAGYFHINGAAALCIWRDAQEAARLAIKATGAPHAE